MHFPGDVQTEGCLSLGVLVIRNPCGHARSDQRILNFAEPEIVLFGLISGPRHFVSLQTVGFVRCIVELVGDVAFHELHPALDARHEHRKNLLRERDVTALHKLGEIVAPFFEFGNVRLQKIDAFIVK